MTAKRTKARKRRGLAIRGGKLRNDRWQLFVPPFDSAGRTTRETLLGHPMRTRKPGSESKCSHTSTCSYTTLACLASENRPPGLWQGAPAWGVPAWPGYARTSVAPHIPVAPSTPHPQRSAITPCIKSGLHRTSFLSTQGPRGQPGRMGAAFRRCGLWSWLRCKYIYPQQSTTHFGDQPTGRASASDSDA